MQPRTLASKGRHCPSFALTLAIGVLLVHSVTASAVDTVQVTVSTSNVTGWTCSDPQIGDAQGGQYVVCVKPEQVTTTDDGSGGVTVTWMLDVTGGWMFPVTQGIVIDAKGNKAKTTGNNKWTVTPCSAGQCTAKNRKENGNKKYGYTVNVLSRGYLLTFDPTIMN
jgi:hypothetical protein